MGGAEKAVRWLLSIVFAYSGTPSRCGNKRCVSLKAERLEDFETLHTFTSS